MAANMVEQAEGNENFIVRSHSLFNYGCLKARHAHIEPFET